MTLAEIEKEISLLEPAEVNTRNVQVLSALYVIRNNLGNVYHAPDYNSSTEFGVLIKKKDISEVMQIMDELMEATYVYNKSLYDATIKRLNE